MANVDLLLINEAFLRDVSSSTPITGGSNIYLCATSITYPFSNITSQKPKINIDPSLTSADTSNGGAGSVGSNWERRKGDVSYQGMNPLIIQIEGIIDLDLPGSISTYQIMTVGRAFKMFNSPQKMPYYYWDSKIGSALINVGYDTTLGNPWHASGSIPVVVDNFNVTWNRESLNHLNYNLTLREDKRD